MPRMFLPFRSALLVFGLSVLVSTGCWNGPAPIETGRTSVLWLTLCTLRSDHLGAYGYPRDVSPTIDSLAERGVLFENALTAAPWTRASMAAAITGIYPRALGIEEPRAVASDRRLLDRFETLAESLQKQGYFTIGITANPNTHRVFNFDQGFDHYQDTGQYLWRTGYRHVKRTAQDVHGEFFDRLDELAPDRPFFAHLTYVDVHGPLLDDVATETLGELAAGFGEGPIDRYDLQIRYLDHAIEGLLGRLGEMGREDLLIVLSSDHGEAFGIKHEGNVEHGRTVYNETTWVPLIFHHPSLTALAGRRAGRVSTASIAPTIRDLLGLEVQTSRPYAPSLKTAVYGEGDQPSSEVGVVETCFLDANRSALIDEPWKLISTYPLGEKRAGERAALRRELYRLDEDPDEAMDLAASVPAKVQELSAQLAAWQAAHAPAQDDEHVETSVPADVLRDLKTLGYIE